MRVRTSVLLVTLAAAVAGCNLPIEPAPPEGPAAGRGEAEVESMPPVSAATH